MSESDAMQNLTNFVFQMFFDSIRPYLRTGNLRLFYGCVGMWS